MAVCFNSIGVYNLAQIPCLNSRQCSSAPSLQVNNYSDRISFGNNYNANFRTKLATKEEEKTYNSISKMLSTEDRKLLNTLLKSGILLNNKSDDKTTVLDNLKEIATT